MATCVIDFAGEPSKNTLVCIGQLIHNEYPRPGQPGRTKFEAVLDKGMPYLDMHGTEPMFRGMALESWQNLHSDFDFFKQNTVKTTNYVHTSTDEEVAESFLEYSPDSKAFVKFVLASDGEVRGVDVQEFQIEYGEKAAKAMTELNADGQGFEYDPLFAVPEQEIILNRDAEFKVVSKQKQKKCPWSKHSDAEYWIVELEQIIK